MTTTKAALPIIEALALLREEAVRNGHEMAPAEWHDGALGSECFKCRAGCVVYMRADLDQLIKRMGTTMRPCVPDERIVKLQELRLR